MAKIVEHQSRNVIFSRKKNRQDCRMWTWCWEYRKSTYWLLKRATHSKHQGNLFVWNSPYQKQNISPFISHLNHQTSVSYIHLALLYFTNNNSTLQIGLNERMKQNESCNVAINLWNISILLLSAFYQGVRLQLCQTLSLFIGNFAPNIRWQGVIKRLQHDCLLAEL